MLAFRRRTGVSNVNYEVQLSDDLLSWTSAGARLQVVSVTPDAGAGTEVVRARLIPPIAELPKDFVRVVLSKK